jgi:hypothetical protein
MSQAAYALTESGRPMGGLLLVHQREPVAAVIDNLVLLWSATDAEEWMGVVAFLPIR